MEQWCCTSNSNGSNSLQFQQTLNTLIETLIKPETLKRDLFFALLLIVIKENDFVLKGNADIDVVDYILAKRINGGPVYELAVVLNPFQDTPAKIIACFLNDTMLINSFIDANKETHSLCLPINRYIIMSSLGTPSGFNKMEELHDSLRVKIVIPMKSSILNYHSLPSSSLSGLPNDVLFQILLSLSITDVLNISESCKRLSKVVKEENLWSRLLRRDFPSMRNNKEVDWRTIYKESYIRKRKREIEMAHNMMRENVIDEVDEWPEDRPVRDSRWEVIL